MKNKTIAAWIALVGGPFGMHRFYLFGAKDTTGWMLLAPTLLGLYGLQRARQFGLDDPWIWLLIPLLGLTIAGCALNAIVYGLMGAEKWNLKFNRATASDLAAGQTGWLTIASVVASLLIGTTILMASLAFSFQRYFEYQIEATRQTPQGTPPATSK
jgi:hypothetical protein